MCGFAGNVNLVGRPVSDKVLSLVLESLSHRGPDARQVWQEGPCTLAHCRLRIIDISARSDQPLERPGRERVVMVYNGEIYNFRALRAELEQEGERFTTESDSEVLLAGYLVWGPDVFRRARGMWAVAFWHPVAQRLVLSRDPLGKKPLVYAERASGIVFASTVGAILPLLDYFPPLDRSALDCYLGNVVVPSEHCIFEGIRKVPPGGIVTWTPRTESHVERFWEVPDQPRDHHEDPGAIEALLRQAVRRRLESDVPLGVFLSAGYDSALVAALAAQESGRSLIAVTAGTSGSGYDERDDAGLVAAQYGLEHRRIEVPAISAVALPQLLAQLGEPFGDASILPTFEVALAARREITVALTGDGGDEGFFGYPVFRAARFAEWYRGVLPAGLRRTLRDRTRGLTAGDWRRRIAAVCEYGAGGFPESFRNRMGFSQAERATLIGDGQPNGHSAEHIYEARLAQRRQLPNADALRRTLFETYLPNDYLPKVDAATMAASLEARCPFLDIDLVEFVLGLSAAVAFPHAQLKALLRPLVRRYLPRALLQRRKTGFNIPTGAWLRGPLLVAFNEFVLKPGSLMVSLVKPGVARDYLDQHRRGADHATRLWALLSLGIWCAVVAERRWSPNDPLPLSKSPAPLG